MKLQYKKEMSREYPSDVLRHRGIYCSSPERIKWCKLYLNRKYRRKNKLVNYDLITKEDE